ncbi:hypothetical protein [Planotetraspora sp. GP83]|uniref:hypothetical protein n=1 Tax=Planotetraspora sp. GP83 TaxID=3156264 RepID=UPI003513240A
MNRGSTLGWVIGGAAFGVGVGSLGDAVNDAMSGNTGATQLIGQLAGTAAPNLVDVYFAAMVNVFGALAAGFAVQARAAAALRGGRRAGRRPCWPRRWAGSGG